MFWVKKIDVDPVYIFLFVFFFTGRIYVFGESYHDKLVLHSIGLWVNNIMFISYIIKASSGKQKTSWCLFFVYGIIAMGVFSTCQALINHDIASAAWNSGSKNSAANNVFGNFGFLQDFFIPVFTMFVFYFLNRRISGRHRNNNG